VLWLEHIVILCVILHGKIVVGTRVDDIGTLDRCHLGEENEMNNNFHYLYTCVLHDEEIGLGMTMQFINEKKKTALRLIALVYVYHIFEKIYCIYWSDCS